VSYKPSNDKLGRHLADAKSALKAGQAKVALTHIKKACKKYAHAAQAWHLHAIASAQLQDFDTAILSGREALRLDPKLIDARVVVANAMAASGKHTEAAQQYKIIARFRPDDYNNLANLGTTLFLSGNAPAALPYLLHALNSRPNNAPLRINIGRIYLKLGQPLYALEHLEEAVKQQPDWIEARIQLADCLKSLGRYRQAANMYEQAVNAAPSRALVYQSLANSYLRLGELSDARSIYKKAIRCCPEKAELTACLAETYTLSGEKNHALELIRPFLESKSPPPIIIDAYAKASNSKKDQDNAIKLIETTLHQKKCSIEDEQILRYTAGKLLDRQKRYDDAFSYFSSANELLPGTFNPDAESKETDHIIDTFSTVKIKLNKIYEPDHSPLLFIVGMPRSGTTLVEQVLTSHPDVISMGELNDINVIAARIVSETSPDNAAQDISHISDALKSHRSAYIETINHINGSARRIIDKMPGNYRHLGLIETLFPHSRVIHCVRHPYDTCLSIYFQAFSRSHNYANRLEDIGYYYLEYQKLMSHWLDTLTLPILEIEYETLVNNQEAVSQKLINFAGLDWDENCLNFHQSKRTITTASYDQVTRPIYRSSVHRWKNYQKYISPLHTILKISPETWTAGYSINQKRT